jgi:hypothetical protein
MEGVALTAPRMPSRSAARRFRVVLTVLLSKFDAIQDDRPDPQLSQWFGTRGRCASPRYVET